ncbi:MAG: Na+/H+ antiporter NhaC, partial [Firmicutes bacterium]|nr:Na+/H+ antiporter NhaC [Bacillota bacterium]
MLSRTLEDCGTLWSPMCPWNSCGVYQTSILGMGPLKYGPYAFLNIINPIYAFITALLGRNIFWGDGSYTNLLGKTHMQAKPAAAPDDAKAAATAAVEALRAEGRIPKISE